MDISQFIGPFLQAARERILRLEKLFLKLEKNTSKDVVQQALREAHTLKGEASMLNFNKISQTAHILESLLEEVRDRKREPNVVIDQLLEELEKIKECLDHIEKETIRKKKKETISLHETIRIKSDLLEKIGNLALETVFNLGQIEKNNIHFRQAIKKEIELKQEWERLSKLLPKKEVETFRKKFFSFFKKLKIIWLRYENILNYQSPITEELFLQSITSRMVPLATIFDLYERQVRDMAKELGKLVDFKISGKEIEVDRVIVEALNEPLIHLLRNAVDHGIEYPDERQKKGKPEIGKIHLTATQQKGKIIIEIEDDGRGIDLNKIKEEALKRGIIWKEKEIGKEIPLEIMEIMAFSGFTTRNQATKFSGRGVGLDIVKKAVEHLNGSWRIFSEPNKGTKIVLELPTSVALLPAILIKANEYFLAVPTKWIESIKEIKLEEVKLLQNREFIRINGESILLLDLNQIIGFPQIYPRSKITVIILSYRGHRCAFKIETLIDNQDIIIKPLNKYISSPLALAYSILEDGSVAIILNVVELIKIASDAEFITTKTFATPKQKTLKILVVDDVFITRTMLKNILMSAGYDVTTAIDGEDALRHLNKTHFDVVLTDIEMPKINGFELISIMKHHPQLKNIPVIIITSHETEEEKQKGIEVGADAYIVKNNFSQKFLFETIERLSR